MIDHLTLKKYLTSYFNLSDFRPGQQEIIMDIMSGKDVLGILPTGSGKSLCYQLPTRLLPGSTIVISPLISLMTDQVKQLRSINFKNVVALNSFMDYDTRKQVLRRLSSYKLIYLSPELLQFEYIQNHLKSVNISLFVIDEAHCISQWGHEFRPDYLKLSRVIDLLGDPPVLALSATAPNHVQADIIKSLKKPNMIKHIYPMDRENIALSISKVNNDSEKVNIIMDLLETYHVPTLIYFSSRKMTESVTKVIEKRLKTRKVAFYHGGMEQMDRITVQQQFMNGQLDTICCTSAFGMGINKQDIYLIIHYHFPAQLEDYIQEIGRAGRDGNTSLSVLLHSENDIYLPQNMIEQELPSEKVLINVFKELTNFSAIMDCPPALGMEFANKLQVNEIQWRYIHYQLEKNDIINHNKVVTYNKSQWKKVFHIINEHRKSRFFLKQKKLMEMITWMNEEGCLRENLYKHFQVGYVHPAIYCCSNCGLSLKNWQPRESKSEPTEPLTWENKLKKLLLIGESYETE